MRIAGLQWTSCLDFPGQLAAVVFTPGCNLDCYYCHNPALLAARPGDGGYAAEAVLRQLSVRVSFLDGVVISGGEPTLQRGLAAFLRRVRKMGYAVKLDTNGTRPDVLRRLLAEGLLDYVAMDVKAPPEKYAEICGGAADVNAIAVSIALLAGSGVDYEFRTTFAPALTGADIAAIARWVRGAKRYVIQQYRCPATGREDTRLTLPPHPPEYIAAAAAGIRGLVETCLLRGVG